MNRQLIELPGASHPRVSGGNVLYTKGSRLYLRKEGDDDQRLTSSLSPPIQGQSHEIKNGLIYYSEQIGDGNSRMMRQTVGGAPQQIGPAIPKAYIWAIDRAGGILWGDYEKEGLGKGFVNETPLERIELPIRFVWSNGSWVVMCSVRETFSGSRPRRWMCGGRKPTWSFRACRYDPG